MSPSGDHLQIKHPYHNFEAVVELFVFVLVDRFTRVNLATYLEDCLVFFVIFQRSSQIYSCICVTRLCDSVHVRVCMCVCVYTDYIILTRNNRGGQRSLNILEGMAGYIVLYPNIKHGSVQMDISFW